MTQVSLNKLTGISDSGPNTWPIILNTKNNARMNATFFRKHVCVTVFICYRQRRFGKTGKDKKYASTFETVKLMSCIQLVYSLPEI